MARLRFVGRVRAAARATWAGYIYDVNFFLAKTKRRVKGSKSKKREKKISGGSGGAETLDSPSLCPGRGGPAVPEEVKKIKKRSRQYVDLGGGPQRP